MGAHRWRQSQHDNRYCFQQYGVFSSKIFLNQAELRSGILEREC